MASSIPWRRADQRRCCVSDADIAANNLVLWGDPQSNAILAKIADKLPIQWSKDKLVANGKTYDATTTRPC
jgi:hypothetical protein